jgi:phosphatidylglycerophosphate synthase
MDPVNGLLDLLRSVAKLVMHSIAHGLNDLTHGKLSPNVVTITAFLMHIPIAYLIAVDENLWAALMLVIFGMFDALDGELARLQGRANNAGMLLDASTDRMKETLLYIGAAYAISQSNQSTWAAWAVAACGASICVSYVKAKGETAVAGGKLSANEVNRLFQDGLFRFEVRMAILVIGLLADGLLTAVILIAITSAYTAIDRLVRISRKISSV